MTSINLKTAIAQCVKKGWVYKKRALHKSYVFKNFEDAFTFMTRCSLAIITMNHHPTWHQTYNKLDIELTTHDTGGVSAKDLALAEIMDKIAARFLTKGLV